MLGMQILFDVPASTLTAALAKVLKGKTSMQRVRLSEQSYLPSFGNVASICTVARMAQNVPILVAEFGEALFILELLNC